MATVNVAKRKGRKTYYRIYCKVNVKPYRINLNYYSFSVADKIRKIVDELEDLRRYDGIVPEQLMKRVSKLDEQVQKRLADIDLIDKVITDTKLDYLFSQYITYLRSKNHSDGRSIDNIDSTLNCTPITYFQNKFWNNVQEGDIESIDITEFLESIDRADGTKGNYRKRISEAYEFGIQEGLVSANTINKEVPTYDIAKPEAKWLQQERVLTPDNIAKQIEALDGEQQCFLGVMRWQGLRAGEMAILRWSDINLSNWAYSCRRKKTAKNKTAREDMPVKFSPIWPQSRSYFKRLKKYSNGSEFVFNEVGGLSDKAEFRKYNEDKTKRIKTGRYEDNNNGTVIRNKLLVLNAGPLWQQFLHALRSARAWELIDDGHPQKDVAEWMSHDVTTQERYYLRSGEARAAAAAKRAEDVANINAGGKRIASFQL